MKIDKRNTNGSATSLAACAAPARSSWPRMESVIMTAVPFCSCSARGRFIFLLRRALRLEIRMHDRAVARERRRLDDVVVPIDGKRPGLLVDQHFEESIEVFGVEARRRGRDPARHIAVTDDLDVAHFRDRIRADTLDIA